jgi:4-hydroxybenzoate polyprenyltransferase
MLHKAVALARSSHPGPSIAVTIVTVVLSIGAQLEPWRVVLLGLAMLLDQLSVGWSNDWLDAERDRTVGRADKPVAAGLVSIRTVRAAAIGAAALAIALTTPLGWAATLVHAIVLASAWSYNARLKNTGISVAPFALSFGLLPALVTLSAGQPAVAAWWALGAGALLGVAAHFSNVLPDLEADRATGIRGLPHRVGLRACGAVIAVSLAAASGLLLFASTGPVHVAGFIVALALAGSTLALVLTRPPTRLLFQLIIAAALLDVVLLALSGSGLR